MRLPYRWNRNHNCNRFDDDVLFELCSLFPRSKTGWKILDPWKSKILIYVLILLKKFSRSLFSHLLKFYFRSLILVLYVLRYKKIIFKARLRLLIFISSISNIFFIQKMSGQSVPTWALAAGQDNFEPENFEDVLENALSMYRVNSRTSAKNTS